MTVHPPLAGSAQVVVEAPELRMRAWPSTRIGNLFEIGAGKSVTPLARQGERKHPFLRTSNILWGRVDLSEISTMHFTDEEIQGKALNKGDLLVCEGGDVGRSAIWRGELEQCAFQNHIHRLRPKTSEIVPWFVMYYLQAGFTQLGIYEGAANKTTIPNLSRSRLAALEVPTPPRIEQEKIAAVLWKVQEAQEIQHNLVRTTRALKAAAMRHLFTRGLRDDAPRESEIGPIPGKWEIVRLGKYYETQLGKMLSEKARGGPSPRPYLRNKNVQWGRIDLSDVLSMDFHDREMTKFKLLPGDLLVCEGGVIGRAAIWHGELAECYYQKALHRVRPRNSARASNQFLAYWLAHAFESQNLYGVGGASSTIAHLPQVLLEGLAVPLPEMDEQAEIVDALRMLDSKIDLHERKLAALRDLFEALLHKLMTAHIRVHDLDIDTSEVTG